MIPKAAAVLAILGSLVAWHLTPVQSFEPEDFSLLQDTAAPKVKPYDGGGWRTAKASWYTGPTNQTADGTRMRLDGQWVASRVRPLGSRIEVRNKAGQTFVFVIRDTPAPRYGHRLDFPKKTWERVVGEKAKVGLVDVEWRPLPGVK